MGLWTAIAHGQAAGTAAGNRNTAGNATGGTGAATAAPGKTGTGGTAAPTTTSNPAAPAAPVTVPQDAYTKPGDNRKLIVDFVKANVDNLLNDADAAAQGKSRENLVAATLPGGVEASPEFLYEYARALNDALQPRLNPANKPSLRQRLNAAIVAARVAYVAKNPMLQEATVLLLKDPAEPIVLWGLKAAQPQVPKLLQIRGVGNKVPPLITEIVPAVFAHPSGPIYEEGYAALTGNDKVIFDELTKLWQSRLTQYQKEVPQDPSADGKPVFTLTTDAMWKNVINNPAAQTRVMQMIADQLSAAAQWADQTPAGDKHDQLVALAKQCADGCWVVGGHQNQPTLRTAADLNKRLDIKTMSPGTKIKPVVDPILQQIMAGFKGVQQPPAVGPAAGPQGVAQP
jgi:hypothetical protein